MKFYFVGLDLRNASFDYAEVLTALDALHGRRVSRRIWLCVVNRSNREAFTNIYRQLAVGDQCW